MRATSKEIKARLGYLLTNDVYSIAANRLLPARAAGLTLRRQGLDAPSFVSLSLLTSSSAPLDQL